MMSTASGEEHGVGGVAKSKRDVSLAKADGTNKDDIGEALMQLALDFEARPLRSNSPPLPSHRVRA